MSRIVLVLILFALPVLAACTSLSEAECQQGDWRAIGARDGAEGRGPERLDAHRRACAGAAVVPDAAEWESGRQAGLRLYCTPAKAYLVGRAGRSIAPGCTTAERARMAPAHARGLDYWRLELRIRDLRGDIRAIDRDLASLAPNSARRGGLFAERMMLISRLHLLEMQQNRHARWP